MRKPLAIGLVSALVICGCVRVPSAASISRAAVTRSNQEAKRLYNVEPFHQKDGQLRAEGQHRVWEALTLARGHDIAAKVAFDQEGSIVSVDVQMLAHPITEPLPNLDDLIGRTKQHERQAIPEVMPK